MIVGSFSVNKQDPKKHAQEQAAKGNWKPTDAMLRKADPDFVQRWFILEARKVEMRKLWRRATLVQRKVEHGTSRADRLNQEAMDFWREYESLDNKWIGDVRDIKAAIAKENLNGSL